MDLMMHKFLLTGCSGGGKSTLIEALAGRGITTVPEPGRRVIAAAQAAGSDALPWQNLSAFLADALELARADLARLKDTAAPVVFDRGVLDAAVALRHHCGTPLDHSFRGAFPYASCVFVAPDWPDLFQVDAERRHSLQDAQAEYRRLLTAIRELRLEPVFLPRTTVADRVSFVMNAIRSRS